MNLIFRPATFFVVRGLAPPQALRFTQSGERERRVTRESLVSKRKGPWEGEKREARFLLPAFLCAQSFIEGETYGYEAGSEIFLV